MTHPDDAPAAPRTRPTRRAMAAVMLAAALALTTACGAASAPPWSGGGVPVGAPSAGAGDTATGELPEDGISPFDDADPAVARLDPALRAALQAATNDARADAVTIRLTSGWRSAAYQEQLLQQAIRDYGSREEAEKWVSTPEQSSHVTGHAVDVGPTDAGSWMDQHGSDHGLCRRYANELWHYELLTTPGGVCPVPLVDASAAG